MFAIIIIVAIIILIIIYLQSHNNKLEHYNDRLENTDFQQCAQLCKTIAGCYGFGYDKNKKICYPSKTIINGRPLDSGIFYKDDYSPDNTVCNKLQPITQAMTNPQFTDRRANSVFICRESADKQPAWYLSYNNQFTNIGAGKNIDEIFTVDDYSVKNYNWPVGKFSIENTDYLLAQRDKQTFGPDQVTNLNRIENPKQPKVLPVKTYPDAPVATSKKLDLGLDKITSFINNINTAIKNTLVIPGGPKSEHFDSGAIAMTNPIPTNDINNTNTNNIFYQANSDLNDGAYLNNYKCVDNIELKSCLDYCTSQDACVGVEYNPVFGLKKNVCCPKRSIGVFKPRDDLRISGTFYQKQYNNDNILNKETIIAI